MVDGTFVLAAKVKTYKWNFIRGVIVFTGDEPQQIVTIISFDSTPIHSSQLS